MRRDPFGRFVSAIAWLPREGFDTRLRERVGEMLAQAYGGRLSAFYIALGDAPLARIQYIIGTDPARPREVDEAVLEAAVAQAARSFGERLGEALTVERGEAAAAGAARPLARRLPARLPRERHRRAGRGRPRAGGARAGRRAARRRPVAPGRGRTGALSLRLVNPGGPLPLADALPLFESLGLRAVEEMPYRLSPESGTTAVLHVFALRPDAALSEQGAPFGATDERFPAVLEALAALLEGRGGGGRVQPARAALRPHLARVLAAAGDVPLAEAGGLRLRAGQRGSGAGGAPDGGAPPARPVPRAAGPGFRRRPRGARARRSSRTGTRCSTSVANPDEDRILARFRLLLDAVLRTNYHQYKPYISFKIDSAAAGDMPAPRPWREVFVHSPRMEGTHLRAGPVARGGIRWSDRREDFRTEILGLMKAQRVKNVVIVPTGAKGGFVLKRPPPAADREAFGAEGVACYQTLVRGLLDITDNLDGERRGAAGAGGAAGRATTPTWSSRPTRAPRPSATSPTALSVEYGFWLGDAFASGGSAGYDHKGMGITARGAWVMVARHFAELGHDIFSQDFTCAGVGDMSGDVFGNGLLISRHTRLVAAFDHRHVFIDPDPDPAVSYAERERLFRLPRSSWADYDAGEDLGGRRRLPARRQARAAVRAGAGDAGHRGGAARAGGGGPRDPAAPVDLLYFGGIGTYVKASAETQAEAGDRANDAVRVDGRDLRARVVGEGANLAVTQAGRVEYARRRRAHQHRCARQLGRRLHQRPRGEHQDPARRCGARRQADAPAARRRCSAR